MQYIALRGSLWADSGHMLAVPTVQEDREATPWDI